MNEPAVYLSPLYIETNLPSVVLYKDLKTQKICGKVYKSQDGRWYLSSEYFNNWHPVEVFAKYEGFLLLNRLRKQYLSDAST